MTQRPQVITALGLLIIGLGALLVGGMASRQKLDAPGVKISPVPLIGEGGRLVRSNSVVLPQHVPGFAFESLPVTDLELSSLPSDTVFGRGRYVADGDKAWMQLNVVVMGTDRTSIHRPEYCLTGVGWKITRQQTLELAPEKGPGPKAVQRFDCLLRAQINGQPTEVGGVYVFWFISRDRETASHWQRQTWMVQDLVTRGVLQRWAYISYFMPCPLGQEDAAYGRVLDLIHKTLPQFEVTRGLVSP